MRDETVSPVYKAYLEHGAALKRFLWRFYKRAEDVDDAAQEAFLRAFRAELEQEIEEPRAFLFRIARNYALSDLAKKANSATEFLADSPASPVLEDERLVGADEQLASKQKLALLVRAVAELPPQCRRVFVMRKFEGKRVKDIAAELGVSVSNIDNQLQVGLKRCMDYMRRHAGVDFRAVEIETDKRQRPSTAKAATGPAND